VHNLSITGPTTYLLFLRLMEKHFITEMKIIIAGAGEVGFPFGQVYCPMRIQYITLIDVIREYGLSYGPPPRLVIWILGRCLGVMATSIAF